MASLASDNNELPSCSSSTRASITPSSTARLKLRYLDRVKILIVSPSQLTFSKLLSIAAHAFPEIQNVSTHASAHNPQHSLLIQNHTSIIELTYHDKGDQVVIDSDESLRLAILSFQEPLELKIQIHLKVHRAIINQQDTTIKSYTSMKTPPSALNRNPRPAPCHHFKSGLCKFGSSCRFSHDVISHYHSGSTIISADSDSILQESKIENQFMTPAPKHSISHLSTPDGFHRSMPRPAGQTPTTPCRHFRAGLCKFGSSCRFSHDVTGHYDGGNKLITADSASILKESEIENQLKTQQKESEHDISSLSSPDGFHRSMRTALNGHPRTTPCQHFRAGLCKFGASCRFLHHVIGHYNGGNKLAISAKSASLLQESDIENWLMAQQNASEHDNISYLSSPDGFDSMVQILDQPHLSDRFISQLVVVLTRPEFRTSMIKQATDKIYNAFIGSKFLATLHSHIRSNVNPTPGCIEPYVFLCEVLVGRTSNGWKEAPLDELKTLMDEVEHDLARDLSCIIARLLDHRAKKKRMDAVDDQMEALSLGSKFRNIPIIPTKEQLLSLENPIQLPVNQVGLRYPSVAAYLDTHFRLLQEDCIATLRDGVHELRRNSRDPNLHVYMNVRLAGIECGYEAIVYRVSFHVNARQRDWESSKRLMYGSLLCISCDTFQTFSWAVVAKRTPELLSNGFIDIQLLEDSDQRRLEASRVYMMAESSAAYFEAYSHVLKNLQRPEMDELPFQEHLISLEPHVKEPAYLKGRNQQDVYDFECAFPLMKKEFLTTRFHILQTWPEWTSSLDRSQMSALKHGLTKRLALIQGPPGTGKTFIGLLIVKIMLENLKQIAPTFHAPSHIKKTRDQTNLQENTIGGPILIICYTNHALDQFLEGIHAYEKNVVRVGGRSKSTELKECNLQTLLQRKQKDLNLSRHEHDYNYGPEYSLYESTRQAYSKKKSLEEEILKCADQINIDVATEELLHGVATEEQIQTLFYDGCITKSVLKMWLNETERETPMDKDADGQLQRSNAQLPMYNPYSVLLGEEEASIELSGSSPDGISHQIGVFEKGSGSSDVEFHGGKKGKDSFGSSNASEGFPQDESLHGDGFLSRSLCANRHEEYEVEIDDYDVGEDSTREGRKDKMKMIVQKDADMVVSQRSEAADDCLPPDLAWTEVKTRKSKPYQAPKGNTTHMMLNKNGDVQEKGKEREKDRPLEMLINHTDVWSLDGQARRILYNYWLDTIQHEAQDKLSLLSTEYEDACRTKLELDNEIQLSLLRRAKVVGMTTTAAARYHHILESLQAEIIIVEEAAEVLESHILACLTASTKHLILIGDHLQLRPSVAVHKLAVKNQLDVSLFERLVKSGIEYVTLEVQRRMRPCISKLISSIYPMLKDHKSVSAHDNIKGIKSNVFFFNHTAPEEHRGDDESGKKNVEEAQLVVELCDYFLKQGYTNTDITILSMYKGQTQEIFHRLKRKLQAKHGQSLQELPRLSSVDDYQGEECKIIILSLVRSNCIPTKGGPGKIGFLKVSNRVCVALSRAKDGLFIFGNGELLCKKSELWNTVIRELQSSKCYGDALILSCQNHPEKETKILKPNDFQDVRDGGCNKPCELQLSCGHACPKQCHPGDHDMIVCPKRCPHKIPSCDHQCQKLCHGFEKCPPCTELVFKELPQCGHSACVTCSTLIESVICKVPCTNVLACSHKCRNTCGMACTTVCKELVERALPCGHSAKIACHLDPLKHLCRQPCQKNLPECQHICRGTCGACKQGEVHIPCQQNCSRTLPCGHLCTSICHKVCPPCSMPCQKKCSHSRCPKNCGYPCVPCMEPCEWKCRHHSCRLLCHELCIRPCCNEPCEKVLGCGHPCLGLCGELCPPICRICTPHFKDIISQMSMEEFDVSNRFVQLQDCGHVFEVSGLDTWMQTEQSESGVHGILPKKCPECRKPVMRSLRYGNDVKAKLRQIEDVKKHIIGFEMTNEGIRHLRERRFAEAINKFVATIEQNMASFQTYFGLGCALCSQSKFSHAVKLFHFIVRHSSLVNGAKDVESVQQARRRAQELSYDDDGSTPWNALRAIIKRTLSDEPLLQDEVGYELAIKALIQWASALSNLRRFTAAMKACQIVLEREPDNKEAAETLRLASNGERRQVVEVMMREVGGRGHWYQCPNGHYYVVGECGGPMQLSTCPDCKATVGGQSHTPAQGNTHANIDGSSHSAWSDHVGLGDLDLRI